MVMPIGGRMRLAQRCAGTIAINPDGTLRERAEAIFEPISFQWVASGSYEIEGQALIMQVNRHTMTGYVGKRLTRRFEFRPGTDNKRGSLHLPIDDGSFTLGIRKVR